MRRKVLLLALIAAVALSGCIEYREQVSLNKDGSGTVKIHFALSADYLKQMNELLQMTAKFSGEEAGEIEQPKIIASKSEIEEFLKQSKSDVKLLEYESPDSSSGGAVDVKFSFGSIAGLDIAAASLFPDDNPAEEMGAKEMEEQSASFVKQDDGTWLFTRTVQNDSDVVASQAGEYDQNGEGALGEAPDNGDMPGMDNEDEAEEAEDDAGNMDLSVDDFVGSDMEALARDMEKAATDTTNPAIKLTVSFPGKVLKSNASTVDGSTATWSFTLQQLSGAIPSMTATIAD